MYRGQSSLSHSSPTEYFHQFAPKKCKKGLLSCDVNFFKLRKCQKTAGWFPWSAVYAEWPDFGLVENAVQGSSWCWHVSRSHSVQFNSVAQSYPTLCDPMDWSTRGFPVHHLLLGLAKTQVHLADDAIQPSHPLLSVSPPTFNLSQHQGLFQWVGSSHQVAKVLAFQLQHQSFQWIVRTDFL